MSKHVVIIGAVALGPKVASRLKRCDPHADITVISKEKLISYGACGIPYFIGGDVSEANELRSTMYHMIRDEEFFRKIKHFNVHTSKEVTSIDRDQKRILLTNLETGHQEEMHYDVLVLATGSRPVLPPLPGSELPGVYTVTTLDQAIEIKRRLSEGLINKVVIVGAGAIGLEMAEAFTDLWGVETTVVEMQNQILPTMLGPEMAQIVKKKLEDNDISILTGTQVSRIIGDQEKGVQSVETNQGQISCQLVLFCAGVKPNSALAEKAGLALGANKGILVDDHLRTSDPAIYAGGDCIELKHLVSGENIHLPLGSLANRQGRVIGTNIAGGSVRFKGTVGNFCLKVFDSGVARAGLTSDQARLAGYDPVSSLVVQPDRAHFYPGSALMCFKLIADRKTRRILGAEAIGPNGDAVKARVDAVAALLPHEVGLEEISNLEVSYSPPFASAMDIVNTGGNVLQNILDGLNQAVDPQQFLEELSNEGIRVLDVRSPDMAKPLQKRFGERWLNIPLSDVAEQIEQIPQDEPLYVFCNTGTTAYEAQRYLQAMGIKNARTVQGSSAVLKDMAPDLFSPSTSEDK